MGEFLKQLGKQLLEALKSFGLVFLKNNAGVVKDKVLEEVDELLEKLENKLVEKTFDGEEGEKLVRQLRDFLKGLKESKDSE